MAESKSVDLFLRVSTVLMGGDVLGKLSSGFGGLAKQVGIVNQAMGKIIGTAAAITIGYKGISAASDWIKKGTDAYSKYQNVQQVLTQRLQKFPDIVKGGPKALAEWETKLYDLSMTMEKEGLTSAQDLMQMFDQLMFMGMHPSLLMTKNFTKGLEGLALKTGQTTLEIADLYNKFIIGGRGAEQLRKLLAITPMEMENVRKMSFYQRGLWLANRIEGSQFVKEAERQLATEEGQAKKRTLMSETTARTVGKPFHELGRVWEETMERMRETLDPIIARLVDKLMPVIEKLEKWLKSPEVQDSITKFGKAVEDGLDWIVKNWQHVSKGLWAIGIAMGALAIVGIITNPLLLAVGAVMALGAAVTLLSMNWGFVKPAIDSALDPLKNIWKEIEPGMKEAGTKIVQFFKGEITWEECWAGISESFAKIKWDVVFQQALEQIQKNISNFGTWMADGLSKIDWGTVLGTVLGTAFRLALEGVKIAQAIGEGLVKAISGGITKTDWGALAKSIGDFGLKFAQAFGNAFAGFDWAGLIAGTPIGKFYSWIAGAAGKTIEAGGQVIGKIGAGISQTPPALVERPAPPELGPMAGEAWTNEVQNFITGVKASQPEVRTVETESGKVSSQIGNWSSMVYGAASSLGEMVSKLGEVETKAAGVGYALSRLQAPTIPTAVEAFQHGGITRGPSIAGEAGPEMILPLNEPGRWGKIIEGLSSFGIRGTRAGGGEINVQVSPNITINGVSGGEAESIGREVQRAMRDPINSLLESLARARDEERRLAYV